MNLEEQPCPQAHFQLFNVHAKKLGLGLGTRIIIFMYRCLSVVEGLYKGFDLETQ